jgi:O-antigen/teichoic acid export membrane protein
LKNKLSHIQQHPQYHKILQWGKLISITGGAQIILQAVGFASGILVIRLLPTQEYALYTLANTMLGTMTVLADGGISTGVMAQGGKVWNDREKLGAVLATGLDLRRKFAVGSLMVSIPILLYLLLHNGAIWLTALLIVLSLIPAFYAALSDSLLEIVPKLHQAILPLQKNQVSVGLGRLLLTGLTLFVFPWTFVAILAAGIPRIYGNIKLRKIVNGLSDKNQIPDKKIRYEIVSLVKQIMPTSIYYCLSGQITIWIISVFGNTTNIAHLGALSRLTMILSIFSSLITTLVIPRFSKLKSDKELLLLRFLQIIGFVFVLLLFLTLVTYLFPKPLLMLLGNSYKDLQFELLLSIIGSCIALLSGIVFSLCSCRGWVMPPFVLIGVNLLAIIIFSITLDVSSLTGVLLFNIGVGLVALLQISLFCTYKIMKITRIDL